MARVALAGTAVDRFLAGTGGRIDIGTFQSASSALLPAMIGKLRAEFPAVDIRVFEEENTGEQQVEAGALDLALTVGARRPGLASTVLLDDPFVLVAKAGELPKGAFPTTHLSGVPMVGYPSDDWCTLEQDEGLRAAGVEPTYVFRSADNGTLLAMVRAGLGWAVMPRLAVDTRDPALAVRMLKPAIPARQVCVVWRRDRTRSPPAARMIELAVEVARERRAAARARTRE